MEIAALIKSLLSLFFIIAIIIVIWLIIKKYSNKLLPNIVSKSNLKTQLVYLDTKNTVIIVEIDKKKYTILSSQNHSLLLDKSDV